MSDREYFDRELCRECGGNGTVRLVGGISVCPRCQGDCWEVISRPRKTLAESWAEQHQREYEEGRREW